MLGNPEMMRNMMTPENLNAAMSMMGGSGGAMPGMGGMPGGMGGMGGMPGGMGGMNPAMMQQMEQMFGGQGGQQPATTAPADDKPPKEKYSSELAQIKEMGFHDEEVVLQALVAANGNVNVALERLFSQMS